MCAPPCCVIARACPSLEYLKCHLGDVVVPFEACVDYHGFRVLAVAKLPVEVAVYSELGDLRKCAEEMVAGSADRGATVANSSRLVDQQLASAARKLNLVRHSVRGSKDILDKAKGGGKGAGSCERRERRS